MTHQDYIAICARIDKAESLPEDAMRERYVRNAYHDLCDQAAAHERTMGVYFNHAIHDRLTRDIVHKLLDDVDSFRDVVDSATRDKISSTILSDLMALATTPEHRVLEIFGYKEVAEDEE